ncbi:hypothetical protein EYR41_011869 [Orbilia oligospora]|uniref:Uncharacterized protein n=1 Tax=Orbilia oligospora TaxID=2813651 RepID=A0A8H2DLJ8_ORBOL|nr:hypothetical protein EYR41_011869 [Orbilia oligospora]
MCWTIYYCQCTHPYPRPSVSDACYCDLYRVSSLKKVCIPCEGLDLMGDEEEDRERWKRQVKRNEVIARWLSRGGSGDRWFDETLLDDSE